MADEPNLQEVQEFRGRGDVPYGDLAAESVKLHHHRAMTPGVVGEAEVVDLLQQLLFKGELASKTEDEMVQDGEEAIPIAAHSHGFVETIDDRDQTMVLRIDFGHVDVKFLIPLDEGHQLIFLPPMRSRIYYL